MEQVTLGLEILRHYYKNYTSELFPVFAKWTDYLTNWAHTDEFARHHIKSNNRWIRRATVVAFEIEAGKGNYLKEVLTICNKLMKDKDEMVQKGISWILKEASKKHPNEVVAFLLHWKPKISRKILSPACKKMPATLKQKVLENKKV